MAGQNTLAFSPDGSQTPSFAPDNKTLYCSPAKQIGHSRETAPN
jgi:hypothetical protein